MEYGIQGTPDHSVLKWTFTLDQCEYSEKDVDMAEDTETTRFDINSKADTFLQSDDVGLALRNTISLLKRSKHSQDDIDKSYYEFIGIVTRKWKTS